MIKQTIVIKISTTEIRLFPDGSSSDGARWRYSAEAGLEWTVMKASTAWQQAPAKYNEQFLEQLEKQLAREIVDE